MGEAPQVGFDYDRFKDTDTSSLCSNTTGTFSAHSTISPPAVKAGNIYPTQQTSHLQTPLDVSALFLRDATLGPARKELRFKKAIFGLGITQLLVGALLLIFNVLAISSSAAAQWYWVVVGMDGSGIWGGIITAVAGLLAILASRRASNCRVVACLVMATIAAIAAGIGVVMNGMWMSSAQRFTRGEYVYSSRSFRADTATSAPLIGCAMGMILSLANVAISIVVASFMCANSACCCSGGGFGNGKTVYIAVPMENLGEVITRNAGANTKVVVMPYNSNKA